MPTYDVVILQATPGGIACAVAAARLGRRILLVERSRHVGGLPANGLGATDIGQRGSTGGFFTEFRNRIQTWYAAAYGADSPQLRDCDDGHKFEPKVAEEVFESFLLEHPDEITVLRETEFLAVPENVTKAAQRLTSLVLRDRKTGKETAVQGRIFVDASYEGDLAAAAGLPFRLGRESAEEFSEPVAGVVYRRWADPRGMEHPGEGDERIQAYNYRICLTKDPDNRVPVECPPGYDRGEYVSLLGDIREKRWTGRIEGEKELHGIGRITNLVYLPNGKTDGNNQHLGFLSTDLPEENYPWPTATWEWRDAFAERLRNYILGLLYFVQNDEELPEDFRAACAEWGLAADEYADNGHFPRQVYVREGRRIEGDYLFTAHDSLPRDHVDSRPPIHPDSVTASHYPLDSHACRKREPGKPHLEGFFSFRNRPYSVPYKVMVNRACDNLLFPVPVSGTHVGFSTLRMEPCWMALGQAAGTAAHLALEEGKAVADIPVDRLRAELLRDGAVLLYFEDAEPGEAGYQGLQLAAVADSCLGQKWKAELDREVDEALLREFARDWPALREDLPELRTRRDVCLALERHYLS